MTIDKVLGYEYIYDPKHPLANASGKVYVHRIVASEKLGRLIRTDEHVHHIDGNKLNNNPENIQVVTRSEHTKIELIKRGWKEKEEKVCPICGKNHKNEMFCSYKCSRIASRKVKNRPTKKKLLSLLENNSFVKVGKLFGVSDNAIRKWLK